jgi:hypothetical protein
MGQWQKANRWARIRDPGQVAAALRLPWTGLCAALILVPGLTAIAQTSLIPTEGLRMDRINLPTPINQPPDPNIQMMMREQHGKQQNFAAANIERRRQISHDSDKLLKLAAELNAEASGTNSDPLSPNLIRKFDDLEKLAHAVKEKMKLTIGPG